MQRRAFTFIELLVVVVVISILMGLILAAVGLVNSASKIAKTKAILQAALVGISASSMRSGTSISPVVHPLANTMTVATTGMNRSVFLRSATVASINIGDTVATTGEALQVADPTTVAASEQPRLMLPTDCYCGLSGPSQTDDPLIFGVSRQRLTILGSGFGMAWYRRLPAISPTYDPLGTGMLQGVPYNNTSTPPYPDAQFLVQSPGDLTNTTTFELDAKKTFDYVLGPEVVSELSAMGGLLTDDITTNPTNLLSNNRLRLCPNGAGESFASYSPVLSRNAPLVQDTDGNWKPYHLRGPALYDAWGREILFFIGSNGAAVLESAGPDGYFCLNPGPNLTFDTPAYSTTLAGDDLNGVSDNVVTSGQK